MRKRFFTLLLLLSSLCLNAQVASLLKDINPGGGSSLYSYMFTTFNNYTLFQAYDGASSDLWITDGTPGETELLKEFPGIGNPINIDLLNSAVVNNKLYFIVEGLLYETDGTVNGTHTSFAISSAQTVQSLSGYNNQLLVTTYDNVVNNFSLWSVDVNTGTTNLLTTGSSFEVSNKGLFNGIMYFIKDASELWATNGTTIGTYQVTLANLVCIRINGTFAGDLYFTAKPFSVANLNNRELYSITVGGFVLQQTNFQDELFPSTAGTGPTGDMFILNNKIYMTCHDIANNGTLFTYQNGTFTSFEPIPLNQYQFDELNNLTMFNNKLYFTIEGILYVLDPINDAIATVQTATYVAYISEMAATNEYLFFSSNDFIAGPLYLNYMDATNLTDLVYIEDFSTIAYSSSLNVSNNQLYVAGSYQGNNLNIEPFCVSSVPDPSYYWTGNSSSDWFNSDNWSTNSVPTLIDNVKILAGKPNYPIITSGYAECNKLKVQAGASLTMTGGLLEVFGEITATVANVFNFNGGTLKLYHGSNFPEDVSFNNLTIQNSNDVENDNKYKVPGDVIIHGNCLIKSTGIDKSLPRIQLFEGDNLIFNKHFNMSDGNIGLPYGSAPTLTDHSKLPSLRFYGSGNSVQNVTVNNKSFFQNAGYPSLACNVVIQSSGVKFYSGLDDISIFNLVVFNNFDLAGKTFRILGKLKYFNDAVTPYRITNSKPKSGKISIENWAEYRFDNNEQVIRMDRIRTLVLDDLTGTDVYTASLADNFSADTLIVKSCCNKVAKLELLGYNLTIGKTTTSSGFLAVDFLNSGIPQGTISLLGNINTPRYTLTAGIINNLTVNSPSGVSLENRMLLDPSHLNYNEVEIYGITKLVKGDVDMKQTSIILTADPVSNINNGKIVETIGNTFVNTTNDSPPDGNFYLSKDTASYLTLSNRNIGGLGFIISCANPLYDISVFRQPTFNIGLNGSSINRTYAVRNTATGNNLNATIKLKYDESELQGLNESELTIYRRASNEPAGVWHLIPSTVNISSNTVVANVGLSQIDYSNDINEITYYTLASSVNPMRVIDESDDQSISKSNTLEAYPNPFNSDLILHFTSDYEEKATIQLYDVTGKIVNQKEVQLEISTNEFYLYSNEHLSSGIYILKVSSLNNNNIIRVVKN